MPVLNLAAMVVHNARQRPCMHMTRASLCTPRPRHVQLRKDINGWVAKYRRDEKFSGRPSYGCDHTLVSVCAPPPALPALPSHSVWYQLCVFWHPTGSACAAAAAANLIGVSNRHTVALNSPAVTPHAPYFAQKHLLCTERNCGALQQLWAHGTHPQEAHGAPLQGLCGPHVIVKLSLLLLLLLLWR
jgi:hypothetical protein